MRARPGSCRDSNPRLRPVKYGVISALGVKKVRWLRNQTSRRALRARLEVSPSRWRPSWHVGSAWGRAHGGCDDPNPQRRVAFCLRDLIRDGDCARGSQAAHLVLAENPPAYAIARLQRRRTNPRSWNSSSSRFAAGCSRLWTAWMNAKRCCRFVTRCGEIRRGAP